MEMELETGPAAAGTESKVLCSTISALAYPSSSCSSHAFNKILFFLMLFKSSN